MNKTYFIVPGILIAAFICIQRPAQQRIEAAAQAHAAQLIRERAVEDARRLTAQHAAAADSRKRTAELQAQEQLKADTKRQNYENLLQRINDQTSAHLAASDGLSTELSALDQQLSELRVRKEATERDSFDLTKKLELQRAFRRSTDLEIQRTSAMVAQRFADSTWASSPAAAARPASK